MDIEKVKRNISKMGAQGASEQEIDAYISGEGVTPEQLREHKSRPQQDNSMLGNALSAVGDAAHTAGEFTGINALSGFVRDSYVGKQDPRYNQLAGFTGDDINDTDILSQIARGKVGTMTDKGYAGVIRDALGDRLMGTKQDVHGQEIISYQNDKGEIVDRYINKPGLDYQDIDRVAESAVPFVFGGGLAGSIAKGMGMGLMGRAAVQGATAVGVDAALQNQAQEDGSGEDYSYSRSALAGLGGAGGEVAGTILTKLFNGRGLVDKTTGKLTEKGRAWAKANRVDPDALNADVQSYIGQNIPKAADPEELAVQARAMEFDIPTSKAQRTNSYDDAFTELQIEKGQRTAAAEKTFKKFKEDQKLAIDNAATAKVGDQLAPKARGKEADSLGGDIRHGLNEIFDRTKTTENKMWDEISPMYPEQSAFQNFSKIINQKADEAGVSPLADLSPSSAKMAEYMEGFMNGELKSDSPGILSSLYKNGEDTAISIDTARRKLLSLKETAEAGSPDARLANKLYEGFNDWIDDAAEKALIQSDDPAAHLALKNARAYTREQHALFAPRDKKGKLTLAAKKIAKIMDGADTPEGVVSAIFGRGSNVNELSEGTVSTLKALKKVMLPSDRAKAFDSVKMAYWGKLVLDKKGNVLSPAKLVTNIDTALNKHKSALKVMFNEQDMALIKRFSKVMKDLHVEHPNPSLTSIGMQQQTRKAVKGFLNATQQRERLVKGNIFRANILSFISKYVDTPLINTGGVLARQHTTQNIAKRSKNLIPNSGGVGAVGTLTGANIEE